MSGAAGLVAGPGEAAWGLAASLPLWGAAAVLLACALAASGCGWWLARRRAATEALARRADHNGLALLRLADEIECHLAALEEAGLPTRRQRHWPGQCRRLALDHLECINRLMLDGDPPRPRRARKLPPRVGPRASA